MEQRICKDISDLIGNTPLIELDRLSPEGGATILAKCEFLNPGGSVKDRIALNMVNAAEQSGALKPGMTIVEATSGNTGIGLAMICAERGYRLILTMPESMSFERRSLVARYGAEVVLTPGDEDMRGATRRAREIIEQNPGCLELGQFDNPANPDSHRKTTGPEILRDTGGNLAAFVAGVGTGGTITGVGEILKEANPEIRVIAVEPAKSAVLSGKKGGPHAIEGIGAGFIPSILNREIIDEVLTVEDLAAFEMSQRLASAESLLVGISSGANVHAARLVAEQLSPEDRIVTVLCDTGTRYFSVEEYFKQQKEYTDSVLL